MDVLNARNTLEGVGSGLWSGFDGDNGLLTPPVGLNVYTVKAGVGWFLVAEVFIMALLIGFPAL